MVRRKRRDRRGGYGSGAHYLVRHNRKEVKLHSYWELSTFRYLKRMRTDFDPQPKPSLLYEDRTGKIRKYTPDFLIREKDGSSWYLEIKPSRFYTKRVKRKISAAASYNRVVIIVWTEHELKKRKIL
ncbi:MAG TPA: hypothetical protein PLK94_11580 [Alphaproteobacteria bacterium]|nr:hypothetical protein [Alphaproteobacteria bacterium]